METPELSASYPSLAHRVALSYLRSLADLALVIPAGADERRRPEMEASERALHAFFSAFFEALYADPEQFGLPLSEDLSLPDQHIDGRLRQEIIQKIKRARAPIEQALDLLQAAGRNGRLEGDALLLPGDDALAKRLKSLRKFLPGLEQVGLAIARGSDGLALRGAAFPAMMPALQALAHAAAGTGDPFLGGFLFARCDFRALQPGYRPHPTELFRVFNAADGARVLALHDYFTQAGFTAIPEIRDVSVWVVKYQGKRQIKSTPLFQVEYQERFERQTRLFVKCASANRITPVIGRHSEALQADFFRRANRCGAPNCTWCKTRKGLGPSRMEFQGDKMTVCWYVNPDVREFDDAAVEVLKEYAVLHAGLAAGRPSPPRG